MSKYRRETAYSTEYSDGQFWFDERNVCNPATGMPAIQTPHSTKATPANGSTAHGELPELGEAASRLPRSVST